MRCGASLVRCMLVSIVAILVSLCSALAVEPDEILANPQLEQRARHISRELRCMVCQNESIDDSHAPLARDLRLIVRERLVAGDSDDAVFSYLTARYGDFVLLRPRLTARTLLLWLAPVLVFCGGAVVSVLTVARRRQDAANMSSPLSEAEETALSRLLAASEVEPALPKRNPPATST